jgi:hypothetical protein
MVIRKRTYPFIILAVMLVLFACKPTQLATEIPFKYHNHAHLTDPFSIELVSGEIIPIRYHDLMLAELTDSLYIVYYREGDKMVFPIHEIKAVRFDVIDSGSKRRNTLKIIGATAGAVYVAVGIAMVFAMIALFTAIFSAI